MIWRAQLTTCALVMMRLPLMTKPEPPRAARRRTATGRSSRGLAENENLNDRPLRLHSLGRT